MKELRKRVYLGALLHDIGKFYQRADKSYEDKFSEFSDSSKQIAKKFCPINDSGSLSFRHVVWTNEFLFQIRSMLIKVPGFEENMAENRMGEDSLSDLACNHHNPQTMMQSLITLADCWSAGMDRRKCSEKGDRNNKQIPLYSVFNEIHKGDYHKAFRLRALSLSEEQFFPEDNIDKQKNEESYQIMWQSFYEELKLLPVDSFNGFAESLLFLLKKYTWCIPSDTVDMTNVSLYEHLKTTAAFADCFYQYKQVYPESFVWNEKERRLILAEGCQPVLLVGGDLSGIQKFIYNIASSKAAVSLKGRSFYLQLLIDSVIQRIISHESIQVNIGNVVYSSGGKFYMLLPNTPKVCEALEELETDFEKYLWDTHKGKLALNLAMIPFSYDKEIKHISFENQTNKNIGDLWKALADKLTILKNQKFKSLLINNFDELFLPIACGGKGRVCAVTGIESNKCVPLNKEDNPDDMIWVLPSVKTQIDLGIALKDADYVLTYKSNKEKSTYLQSKSACNIKMAGISTYLFDKIEVINNDAEFRKISLADTCRVKKINDVNFLNAQLKRQDVGYGFQFYGGNEQALISKAPKKNKTFDELSDNTYLGVLRLDVDNLGKLFIVGLPPQDRNFSTYSTLSFLLDYFFSGFLNTIRKRTDFCNDVNVLYSGGDDVFAIGKWNNLISFAHAIRTDFEKFVGRNDISISGGIVFVHDKFPIAKAAQMAGDAEDKAKEYKNEKTKGIKNAINIFGRNVSWNEDYDFVYKYERNFYNLCFLNHMPTSILHKMQQLNMVREKGDISYVWNAIYFITRFIEDKKDKKIVDFCVELNNDLLKIKTNNFELIAIAARWAELDLRFNGEK